MNRELTPRQRDVVSAIERITRERRRPPTMLELAQELGISKRGAHDHVLRLEERGVVEWEHGLSRTLRIVAPTAEASSADIDPLIDAARVALRAFGMENELDEVLASRGPGPYQLADHPVISVLANLAHDVRDLGPEVDTL